MDGFKCERFPWTSTQLFINSVRIYPKLKNNKMVMENVDKPDKNQSTFQKFSWRQQRRGDAKTALARKNLALSR